MRIILATSIVLGLVASLHAEWEGEGTFDDPYVYTSPVVDGEQFVVVRGQTMFDDDFILDGTKYVDMDYEQLQSREEFEHKEGLGMIRSKFEGSFQELDWFIESNQDVYGTWKPIAEDIENFSGIIREFVSPINPPEVVGAWETKYTQSKMTQDIWGDVGTLQIVGQLQDANPDPNNDPPADDLTFTFSFDLPGDTWTAGVYREVDGSVDMTGLDTGDWNPYGVGTDISLPNPSQPLSGLDTDWYIDGTNADDAWTLMNNVHWHPGPITFSFAPFSEEYLTEYEFYP